MSDEKATEIPLHSAYRGAKAPLIVEAANGAICGSDPGGPVRQDLADDAAVDRPRRRP